VNRSETALEGFRRMHSAGVGAVAVVGTTTHAIYAVLGHSPPIILYILYYMHQFSHSNALADPVSVGSSWFDLSKSQ